MSSVDVLCAGLPLVHRKGGDKMMQAAGGSVIIAAGLEDELLARNVTDYKE